MTGSYVSDLLPFILLMSLGMGVTFVPLTLTAVHHLRDEDSGIGSGVLNTMQQVGGALGLAILASAATRIFTDRGAELSAAGGGRRWPAADPDAGRDPAAGLHRGRDQRVPGGLADDAARLGRDLDVPQRQARGAGHRRPEGAHVGV